MSAYPWPDIANAISQYLAQDMSAGGLTFICAWCIVGRLILFLHRALPNWR